MMRAVAQLLRILAILAICLGAVGPATSRADARAPRPAGHQGGMADADKQKPPSAVPAGPGRLQGPSAAALPRHSAYAWGGQNGYGEFGDGTTAAAFGPVKVRLDDIRGVAAGDDHSIFLLNDGRVFSVGRNLYGQLGDGTTTDKNAPVQVVNLPGAATQIAAGDQHGLALVGDQLYSWGYNANGQIGDGTSVDRPTPVAIPLPAPVTAIAGGAATYQTLAIAGGAVYAWGFNGDGELGDGTMVDRPTPEAVPGLTGTFIAVAAGEDNSLALRDDGAVFGWGFNGAGELCVGDTNAHLSPAQALDPAGSAPFAGAIGIGLGSDHGFIIGPGGTLYGCGTGTNGELGTGSNAASIPLPAPVRDPVNSEAVAGVVQVVGGEDHSVFLRADGTVYAMGANTVGQIGTGRADGASYFTPARVVGLRGVSQLAASKFFTLAVVNDAALTANPPSLTFGAQPPGTTSPPQSVTLTSASGPLNLAGIATDDDFAQTNNCPATLAAGQSCTIAVTFSPTEAGARTGALTVGSDADDVPLRVALGGTGIASYTVTASATGAGVIDQSGATAYTDGTLARYTATPAAGQVFVGWTLDGKYVGYASPLDFTVTGNRVLVAQFAPRPSFADIPAADQDYEAITRLAALGIVNPRGVNGTGNFEPDRPAARAEVAAFVARLFGWQNEFHGNTFPDRCDPLGSAGCVDDELWNDVAALKDYGVVGGYTDPATCQSAGTVAPCYLPRDRVLRVQVVSIIARAFTKAPDLRQTGFWDRLPAVAGQYANVPDEGSQRSDLATYRANAGPVPGQPSDAEFPAPADTGSRRFVIAALWQAYSAQYRVDQVP